MTFGQAEVDATELAHQLVAGVPEEVKKKPPCTGGSRKEWTDVIVTVLKDLGERRGYSAYPWLLDLIWWSRTPERMVLAVESELDPGAKAIEDDFQKLPVFKCPLKLFVFTGDAERTKNMAEAYLQSFTQYAMEEKYLFVGFTASGPTSFLLTFR